MHLSITRKPQVYLYSGRVIRSPQYLCLEQPVKPYRKEYVAPEVIQGPEHWKCVCEAVGKAKVDRKARDAWELGTSLPFHELALHHGEGLPLWYPPMLEIKDSLVRARGKQDRVCSSSHRHRGLWNVLRTKARLGTSLGQPSLYKLPEGTGKLCLSRGGSYYVEKRGPVTVTKKQYCSGPTGEFLGQSFVTERSLWLLGSVVAAVPGRFLCAVCPLFTQHLDFDGFSTKPHG